MRRKGLTDTGIAALPRQAKRYVIADPELRGLYLRVPPRGPIAFTAVTRDAYGKQVWATIGTTADLKVDQARDMARLAIRRIKEGKPAFEPPKPKPDSVADVADNWLKRHVEKNKLRTAYEIRRVINVYVLPYWRDRVFVKIRRSDIAALLDAIEDKHGARQADIVLDTVRSMANWVQSRDDTYVPPFARGMRRVTKEQHHRARILTDDEIRKLWRDTEDLGPAGGVMRILLLTAQRRSKVLRMRWQDVADGVWKLQLRPGERQCRRIEAATAGARHPSGAAALCGRR